MFCREELPLKASIIKGHNDSSKHKVGIKGDAGLGKEEGYFNTGGHEEECCCYLKEEDNMLAPILSFFFFSAKFT